MDSTAKLKDSTSEEEEEEKEEEKKEEEKKEEEKMEEENEEEEKEETLNEKIDRLALENSEDDEDFDVSNQISVFSFNIRYSFSHPGRYR